MEFCHEKRIVSSPTQEHKFEIVQIGNSWINVERILSENVSFMYQMLTFQNNFKITRIDVLVLKIKWKKSFKIALKEIHDDSFLYSNTKHGVPILNHMQVLTFYNKKGWIHLWKKN